MTEDKFSALWISYSSVSDYLNCPRLYFLKNIYRNPNTGNKIQLTSPPLSLGSVVHEVIDYLSGLPTRERLKEPFTLILARFWSQISGKQGGFQDKASEQKYKDRAEAMLSYLYHNPGPVKNLAVKIQMDLPYFWLSKAENIILCGRIDWLEFLEDSDSVHVIDFKTGNKTEPADSLQLPTYYLIASNCQHRPVAKQSYWYLEKQTLPVSVEIPTYDVIESKLMEIALKIKTARKLNSFKCPHQGCIYCRPYEAILKNEAVFLGTNSRNIDIYLANKVITPVKQSIVL